MADNITLGVFEANCHIKVCTLKKYHNLSKGMYKEYPDESEELLKFKFQLFTEIDPENNKIIYNEDFDLEKKATKVFFDWKSDDPDVELSEEEFSELDMHIEAMLCISHNFIANDLPILKSFFYDVKFDYFEESNNEAAPSELLTLARKDLKELASLLYMRDKEPQACKIVFDKYNGNKKDVDLQVVIGDKHWQDGKAAIEQQAILDAIILTKFNWLKADPNPIVRNLIFRLDIFDKKPFEATYECIIGLYDIIKPDAEPQKKSSSADNLFRGMLSKTLISYIKNEAVKEINISETSKKLLIYSIFLSQGVIDPEIANNHPTWKEKFDYIRHLPADTESFPKIKLSQ